MKSRAPSESRRCATSSAKRLAIRPRRFRTHDAAIVRRSHQALQMQRRARAAREGRHRHVATAVQRAVHRALGFDARRAWPHRRARRNSAQRRARRRRDIRSRSRPAPAPAATPAHPGACGCAIVETQPRKPGAGEHDGVVVARVELRQPRVDVAAQVAAARRSGRRARSCAWRRSDEVPTRAPCGSVVDVVEAVADERVGGVGARQDRRQREARLQLHRHVLERMHRAIGFAAQHRHFEFLEEQALAADRRERAVEHFVAARAHRHQHDVEAGMRGAQPRRRRVRSATGRAGSCGWRCGAWCMRPLSRLAIDSSRHAASASQVLHRLAQARHAAPADFQRLLAVAQHGLHVAVGGALSSTISWRATRQLRWMRTKRSPNSSSSDFSDSSIRSSPRAWCTTTYFSSACR